MNALPEHQSVLTPGEFCRTLLLALEAAEGQTRRRKRDQAPDRLGLATKRDLLDRAANANPSDAEFEAWLLGQIDGAEAPGAVRAMCGEIYQDYQLARLQPQMAHWLAHGAPSDDAEPRGERRHRSEGGQRVDERTGDRRAPGERVGGEADRWRGTDDQDYACTCHLPMR